QQVAEIERLREGTDWHIQVRVNVDHSRHYERPARGELFPARSVNGRIHPFHNASAVDVEVLSRDDRPFRQLDQLRIHDVQPARLAWPWFVWPSIGVSSSDQRNRSCRAAEEHEEGNGEKRSGHPWPPPRRPPEPRYQEKQHNVSEEIDPGHL